MSKGNRTRANKAAKGFGKQLEAQPRWITCSHGALRLFASVEDYKSHHFITPGFNPASVDVTKPQTLNTWKDLILSSPEAKEADKLPKMFRVNEHVSAVAAYIGKKVRKGMVIFNDSAPDWIPLEIFLELAGDARVLGGQYVSSVSNLGVAVDAHAG